MARHINTRPLDLKAYRDVRETTAQRHRREVSAVRQASVSIDNGHCPECGREMTTSGACSVCAFRLIIIEPLPYDPRSTFHRRPTKKSYASRPVPS